MVEIEGERTLAASCIREPAEGMVVRPPRPGEKRRARWSWRLLLADQPSARTAHDRSAISGTWPRNGRLESRFPALEPDRIPLLDDSHVAMRVNLDACIQCNLCVRACREVQVNDVIGMAGRGHDAYPCSISTTRWATAPAWPAANACRPARPAR
jgi:formate dehydrogenase major subunit